VEKVPRYAAAPSGWTRMSRMNSADVAIAGCRRLSTADPTDLYPDPDAAPLLRALDRLGAAASVVSWDDPQVDWGSFARVLVSSTWDSVDRPVEYRAWARAVSAVSVLVNPARMIEWNLDKQHQKGLEDAVSPSFRQAGSVPVRRGTPLRSSSSSSRPSRPGVGAPPATPARTSVGPLPTYGASRRRARP
jgi:hypothetical protein